MYLYWGVQNKETLLIRFRFPRSLYWTICLAVYINFTIWFAWQSTIVHIPIYIDRLVSLLLHSWLGLGNIMIISWNRDNESRDNRTVRIFNTMIQEHNIIIPIYYLKFIMIMENLHYLLTQLFTHIKHRS